MKREKERENEENNFDLETNSVIKCRVRFLCLAILKIGSLIQNGLQ